MSDLSLRLASQQIRVPRSHGSVALSGPRMQWDYIIVGAGSSGCAVAHELARGGRNKVLLLEAGGTNRSLRIKVPACVDQLGEKFGWGYVSEPDASREGRTEPWLRGRVLGGSSSINGMMFVRGAAADFDRWAQLGNAGWTYAEVLPIFRDLESSDRENRWRGAGGPLYVRTVTRPHPLTEAFVTSAAEAGIRLNDDYNAETQEGVAYAQLSQRRGLRWSAADAFIRPLAKFKNFQLLLGAQVRRVELDEGRATGVTVTHDGATRDYSARRVILCAGAIDTPKLLMLSGIGDPHELHRHGIKTVIDVPGVGKNLQEHPLVRLVYKSRIESNNLTGGLMQKLRIAAQFVLHRTGPIATPFEATAFIRSAPQRERPDLQVHFVPVGLMSFDPKDSPFLKYPSFSIYVNQSYPAGRGAIKLASHNPADAPRIECSLLSGAGDLQSLIEGIQAIRKIVATPPLREWVEAEIAPGPQFGSVEALRRYVPTHTDIAFHPVGTCRMGVDPAAVVDPQLRVKGVENLWIADASIMPDLISGNTNAVCMMIGMKLGRQLNA